MSSFSEHERGTIGDVLNCLNLEKDLFSSVAYFLKDSFRITNKHKKSSSIIFITGMLVQVIN